MNAISTNVIIADTLEGIGQGKLTSYLAHALCLDGEAEFDFNGKRFSLNKGNLAIIRCGNRVEKIETSPDFKVKVVYLHEAFTELSTPMTNYGMRGAVALFLNPVMKLTDCQFDIIRQDFANVEYRLNTTCFNFYEEGLRCAVQPMILDFFNFHSRQEGMASISVQTANILSGFFDLLENGEYLTDREVAHYASKLCISPKYLSEVCKRASGQTANFWIVRYTLRGITRMLRDKTLTIVQIADKFHFSSAAYLSRYVQKYLGKTPGELRD